VNQSVIAIIETGNTEADFGTSQIRKQTEERICANLKLLKVDFFFAKPYHSGERGANENTNGFIRQYFPKKLLLKVFLIRI